MTVDVPIPESYLAPFEPGSVWLAGAGPGDPGLLTLLALHGLREADAIVHDSLVDERILALARPDAMLIHAGKRGGRPSAAQEDISRRLVELAREGLRVLRLKGGDPCVFGRGGEEAETLAAAGIPFRFVPGITAGIGGLAYAGIPATHRSANQAVVLATGFSKANATDWRTMAATSAPLVLYMAWRTLPDIAAALIEGGRSPATPVAIVADATTPRQRVLETTLATAADDLAASGMEPPTIVVIGDTVRLRPTLGWFATDGEDPEAAGDRESV